jgi:hypothetical protein
VVNDGQEAQRRDCPQDRHGDLLVCGGTQAAWRALVIGGEPGSGARLHRREWGSAAAMSAGLAGLLYFLSPSGGRTENVRWYTWIIAMGVNLAFVAALVAWGRRGPAGRGGEGGKSSALQAAVLAVAAGPRSG